MKTKALVILILAVFNTSLFAQKMSEGTNFLSFGVGPRMSYYSVKAIGMPAVRISFDHGLKEIGPGYLTLGGALGFTNYHYSGNYTYWDNLVLKTGTYKENWMVIMAAFRVGYYYNFKELGIPNLNAFAGMASGFRYNIYTDSYTGPGTFTPTDVNAVNFHMAGFAGANYFVSKKLAFFTEFGYDFSAFTAGITLQL